MYMIYINNLFTFQGRSYTIVFVLGYYAIELANIGNWVAQFYFIDHILNGYFQNISEVSLDLVFPVTGNFSFFFFK